MDPGSRSTVDELRKTVKEHGGLLKTLAVCAAVVVVSRKVGSVVAPRSKQGYRTTY